MALFLVGITTTWAQKDIFVETESFTNKGGWKVDHQAFPIIHSAYMLAHGVGTPVKDMTTTVKAKPGTYHLYASTYNWTAPWYDKAGPGKFTVKVNNKQVGGTLGDQGDSWRWVYVGEVKLKANNQLALHDLTGFAGRCDALCFRTKKTAPPAFEKLAKADKFRNKLIGNVKPKMTGKKDLVVVGAGIAGMATALTAAQRGLKVALVDNLPFLGGNYYLGVSANGLMCLNKYPNLGYNTCRVIGVRLNHKNDAKAYSRWANGCGLNLDQRNKARRDSIIKADGIKKYRNPREGRALANKKILEDAGVEIYQGIHVYKTVMKGKHIKAVIGKSLLTGKDFRFDAAQFSDCTGDGDVGFLAGADFMIGREARSFANESNAPEVADNKKMGSTLWWGAKKMNSPQQFPDVTDLPWAMQCSDDYYVEGIKGGWYWETGMTYNNATQAELIRDNMFRAIYGNWAYIHNHIDKFKNYSLKNIDHIGKKRESRRIVGDVILSQNHITNKKQWPDASYTTTWALDLHYAKPENSKHFPGWEWQTYCNNDDKSAWVQHYDVPYRVLYSKDIDNLFVGGRGISVTHEALGTTRIQGTAGMAGEVTAMAASICKKYNCTPREVYTKHLDELKKLMQEGTPKN